MYINPFWAGVGCTIVAELIVLVLASLATYYKQEK